MPRYCPAVDYDVSVGILRLSVPPHGVRALEYLHVFCQRRKDRKLTHKKRMKIFAVALSVIAILLCQVAASHSGEATHIHAQVLCCCVSQMR